MNLRSLIIMLSSSNDHEVMAAVRAIDRRLKASGRDWFWLSEQVPEDDVAIKPQKPKPQFRGTGPMPMQNMNLLDMLLLIGKHHPKLSKARQRILESIKEKANCYGNNAYLSYGQLNMLKELCTELKQQEEDA